MVRGQADATGPAVAGGQGRWGDLRLRVLSSLVLVPVALACLWQGGPLWDALVGVTAIGLGVEWRLLCKRLPPGPGRAATLWAGVPYIGCGTAALLWLRGLPDAGAWLVLMLVLAVWASDIGAYLVGRLVGGPKLAPRISPGKTWSGAAGGLLAAGLAGFSVYGVRGAAFAAVLGIAAQGGDLLESALKRHFGVKDSGRTIPGHGGLLDRLDGMLVAAPVAAAGVLLGAIDVMG